MCGRFTAAKKADEIAKTFGLKAGKVPPIAPQYNVSPSSPVLGLYAQGREKRLDYFTWGLVPVWAKDPLIGSRMINARAETVLEKPSFRGPFKNSRCLVVADGFYEWKRTGQAKQPYFVHLKSGDPFGFAGLWSHWTGPDGSEIKSCAILTTAPNALMRPIHDRMPVILPREHIDEWLDHDCFESVRLAGLLKPYPDEALEAYPVGTFVNSPSNDSPKCVEREGPGPQMTLRRLV